MIRQLTFLIGALCVIAALSVLQLNFINSQYAAVALHDATQSVATSTPYTPLPSADSAPDITPFPLTPKAPSVSSAPTQGTAATSTTPAPMSATPKPSAPESYAPANTDFSLINTATRNAVVNIICTAPNSSGPLSGSGVIIDPRGVILTNAHVGQYILLSETAGISLDCEIRTGSPAHAAYSARVIYISQQWIHDHAHEIREEDPLGTGENDYALLRITGSITGAALPSSFAFLTPNTNETAQSEGQHVLAASYPAGFLSGSSALYDLNLVSTITTIKKLFTFSEAHTADLISLGGIIVAQSGSSGGAVVDGLGHLIGIIATSSLGEQTSQRDLRAVTLYHINHSFIHETGKSLSAYLSGNLSDIQRSFDKTIAPKLEMELYNGLNATTTPTSSS